jgi:hypothetical protein
MGLLLLLHGIPHTLDQIARHQGLLRLVAIRSYGLGGRADKIRSDLVPPRPLGSVRDRQTRERA